MNGITTEICFWPGSLPSAESLSFLRICLPILFFLAFSISTLAQNASEVSSPVKQNVPEVSEQQQSACQYQEGKAPEMVVLQGGEFVMGSVELSDVELLRTVLVQPFAMGRCEVTVAEFAEFVKQTSYLTEAESSGGCYGRNEEKQDLELKPETSWLAPGFEQTERSPVTCLTWNDVQAYILWLNIRSGAEYRLPSEAEWEYAARAGSSTAFSTGECISGELANFGGIVNEAYKECPIHPSPPGRSTAVASYPANPFGLYDMHGNVWEWIEGCWSFNYQEALDTELAWLEENSGDCRYGGLRGGSWDVSADALRSALRAKANPDVRSNDLGFRLARTLSNEERNNTPSKRAD